MSLANRSDCHCSEKFLEPMPSVSSIKQNAVHYMTTGDLQVITVVHDASSVTHCNR